jgi:hypothetical protein
MLLQAGCSKAYLMVVMAQVLLATDVSLGQSTDDFSENDEGASCEAGTLRHYNAVLGPRRARIYIPFSIDWIYGRFRLLCLRDSLIALNCLALRLPTPADLRRARSDRPHVLIVFHLIFKVALQSTISSRALTSASPPVSIPRGIGFAVWALSPRPAQT